MIKFSCPHCKRTLSVKDHLAGKRAACPACKKPLTIPAAVAQPADVEALAAAALADQPAEAAKPTLIDFRCPQCDEEIHVNSELGGKQTPCPECRRIIKVPLPAKQDPKDWRKVQNTGPSGARRDPVPHLEGAWGTETSQAKVSRQALVEADVIQEVREPWTLAQKLKWGGAGVTLLLVLVAVVGLLWRARAQGRQERAVARALQFVEDDKVKSPEAAAEVHRAAGEYYLRASKAEQARGQFQKARARLGGAGAGSAERDCVLIDLALAQIDLGGEKEDIEKGARLKWDEVHKELRQTLQLLHAPEARFDAVTQVGRKLIGKGQAGAAGQLASLISAGDEGAEAQALVGLELLRANQSEAALQRIDGAAQLLPPPPPKLEGPRAKNFPNAPEFIALAFALNKPEKATAYVAEPRGGQEPDRLARVGYAEGLALKGDWERAKNLAAFPGPAEDRLEATVAVAEVAADKSPENVRPLLEAAVGLLEREVKPGSVSPWLLLRLVRAGVQAGLGDPLPAVAAAVPDPALRGRAQLALLRSRLAAGGGTDDSVRQIVAKDTPAHGLALEAIARQDTRSGNDSAVQKDIESWEPDQLRPFGYVGLALGLQDAGR